MALAGKFQNSIEIYLRLGPVAGEATAEYELDPEEKVVEWLVPRQAAIGITNHQRERYNFTFTGILGTDAKQDVVFDTVARKVVVGALDGYNGTIFAYGQTGSGKTYTITGSAERYVDRGLIPRALSLIFGELEKRTEYKYQLHFAYLEIYNEIGYDLLNPDHETKALEDLPKVTMLEDGDNCFHLRNLSQHLATNEEEALNLLFMGETNRTISATPMNLASSRSHCIFTITIEAREEGQARVRKSKLHLVDLAGSERVWKTGVDGQVLREAKYINLSLHFLEQVMVATVTVAQQQLEETISTCRFAQRVALVSNQVTLNEEIDPKLLIKRLKQEIKDMKEELRVLRGKQESGPLTADELAYLQSQINNYVSDSLSDASQNCGGTMVQNHPSFQILKEMLSRIADKGLNSKVGKVEMLPSCVLDNAIESTSSPSLEQTISDLNRQLQQKENEINILVSFIKKREKEVVSASATTQFPDSPNASYSPSFQDMKALRVSHGCELHTDLHLGQVQGSAKVSSLLNEDGDGKGCNEVLPCAMSCTEDRRAAFEIFRSRYIKWGAIEENKTNLKAKYAEAKILGDQVNKARGMINEMKVQVEKCRVDQAIHNLMQEGESLSGQIDKKEEELISLLENKKKEYKDNFNALKDLKKEIERLHILLEQSQIELQMDFDKWTMSLTQEETDVYGGEVN